MKTLRLFVVLITVLWPLPAFAQQTWGDLIGAGGKALALRYDAGYKPDIFLIDFNTPKPGVDESTLLSEDDLKKHLALELRRKIGKNLNMLSDNTWINSVKKVEADCVISIMVYERYNEHSPIHRVSLTLNTVRFSGHSDYKEEKET